MTFNKDKVLSICFGVSLIYWGIIGLFTNYQGWDTSVIRIFITLLNLTVGSLMVFREPVIIYSQFSTILKSLPSLLCGGLAFKLSGDLSDWKMFSNILFLLGGCITMISFLFLGKSFAIFPSLRTVVSKGTYKFIRHPSYFGELLMIIACLIATKYIYAWLILPFFIPFIVIRIKEEEKLLQTSIHYTYYCDKVRWRLLPFIW